MCFFSYINLTDSSGNCSFAELSKVLEPGKAAKTDKSSIITDAIRIVTQLRAENGQLRQLNKFLEVCNMPAGQTAVQYPCTCVSSFMPFKRPQPLLKA